MGNLGRVVVAKRLIVASLAGALIASGSLVAPAFGAPEVPRARVAQRAASPVASFGAFTPAAGDPRLAAAVARSGLDGDSFHFTPAESRRANRAVTVAVRSRAVRSEVASAERPAAPAQSGTVGLAPIAYNLGVAVGWKEFAIAGDISHVELAGQPGSRESADVGVAYSINRFTTRVKGAINRPIANAPRVAQEPSSYSVDLGGSYSVTHNVDLTAGVRYRIDRNRLEQIDDRRDSKAVYVGTAFRF